ncbi:entericidin A/B family lipoprotein [Sulfitobacter sabulilitoris]|uniref:Entericidin A/B family lipoprotein n=1 Tax=Sulfitobacter sabulilitoris TaxID=2562655 RepID=A0A5S3PC15_9RHOB|nr:entericidin A/B family lipoprotein [Sulfitobacter sabulilitoris]TMM51248.1 entericidin A/B family lipoprotein [Sulfitobacter sabulilitoris]
MLRLALMIAALVTVSACETAKGVGRDVEKAGRGIQRAF